MDEAERRLKAKAWNDPPVFTYDQINKANSSVPLHKRYKYAQPVETNQAAMPAASYQQVGQPMASNTSGYGFMQQSAVSTAYNQTAYIPQNTQPTYTHGSNFAPTSNQQMPQFQQPNASFGYPNYQNQSHQFQSQPFVANPPPTMYSTNQQMR